MGSGLPGSSDRVTFTVACLCKLHSQVLGPSWHQTLLWSRFFLASFVFQLQIHDGLPSQERGTGLYPNSAAQRLA